MYSNSQLLELANAEAHQAWARLNSVFVPIGDCPIIVLNNRLTKTAGRAWLDNSKIDLSTKLFRFNVEEFLAQTIPHELAHFVAWRVFGHANHGTPWKHVMKTYGIEPHIYHYMVDWSEPK